MLLYHRKHCTDPVSCTAKIIDVHITILLVLLRTSYVDTQEESHKLQAAKCNLSPSCGSYRYLCSTLRSLYRLVQIERPKLCPRLMTNAIPNQYAQIWYRRKAREKIKRVTWLDFGVRRWAWRCGRKQVSANQNP